MSTSQKFLSISVLTLAAACGGNVFTSDATDGGPGGNDSGSNDGGVVSACPVDPPTNGSSCTVSNLQCEYGSHREASCNTLATCSNQKWQVTVPPVDSCTTNPTPPSCPATFKDVPTGTSCSAVYPLYCQYPEGSCGCTSQFGGPVPLDAGGQATWSCDKPAAGCPMPRPQIGSACKQESLDCQYSLCSLPTAIDVVCKSGAWQQQMVACAQ